MSGESLVRLVFVAAIGALGGCEQRVAPAPAPAAAATADPALRTHAGSAYSDFIVLPGMERYAPSQLPISDASRVRLSRAMGLSAPSWTIEGGGSEALVFVGCAEGACESAAGIVAIDLGTGAAFAAVRDGEGRDVLAANERLEALVMATSPADRWDDPQAWAEQPDPPPP